jgi:hypothetical protein
MLQLLERALDYFNSWAFIYVALYGYDYVTAGTRVMALLRARGWISIVTDRLLYRVLTYGKWAIGAFSGLLVVLLDTLIGGFGGSMVDKEERQAWRLLLFTVGSLAGVVLADVSFRIVESAVRTVIVCFAESPDDAARWHPLEVECLRDGWLQSYPEELTSQREATTDVLLP